MYFRGYSRLKAHFVRFFDFLLSRPRLLISPFFSSSSSCCYCCWLRPFPSLSLDFAARVCWMGGRRVTDVFRWYCWIFSKKTYGCSSIYTHSVCIYQSISLFIFFSGGGGGACLSFLWLSASDFLVHFVFVFIIMIIFFSFGYWRCEPVSDAYTSRWCPQPIYI